MIERYEVDEISKIWNRENKYRKWLEVELAIVETWYKFGKIPKKSFENIQKNADFSLKKIDEIEKRVKHDVIAFLTSIEEHVGKDSAYIHMGVTSYDIVDTALSLMIKESIKIIINKANKLKNILIQEAFKYKNLQSIGRTHGVHAEPITFGIKYLIWHEEIKRNINRLINAREIISVGKISGSVGTYIHFSPEGEEIALKKLNLKPCKVSSQIIQRDRHMQVIYAIASIVSGIEKIAIEIRHLQKTEVLEVEEPFTKGQKGSSSMPHKKNPVKCERISGLARILRGNLSVAFENNLLWHERDISHSSSERVIFPDSFHITAFILDEITYIIENINVYPENMKKNLDMTNEAYYSQKILTLLVNKAIPRQKAYELVQKSALESWTKKKSFKSLIFKDKEINSLCTESELNKAFSEKDLFAGINKIFKKFEYEKKS